MTPRSPLCAALVLVLVSSCGSPLLNPATCPEEGNPSWVEIPGSTLQCTAGSLSLALVAERTPVVADGRSVVWAVVRAGKDFPLSGREVLLTVAGGSFQPAESGPFKVRTDADGVAVAPIQVNNEMKPLIVRASFEGVVVDDAGTQDRAAAMAAIELAPEPLSGLSLAFEQAAVAAGGGTDFTIKAFVGAGQSALSRGGQQVDLCLAADQDVSLSASRLVVESTGSVKGRLSVAEGLASRRMVWLGACPSAVGCEKQAASCHRASIELKPKAPSIMRLALSLERASMSAGSTQTLTLLGYQDEALTSAAAEGSAVALCTASPGRLNATTVMLGAGGKATAVFSAEEVGTQVAITACPASLGCTVGSSEPRCATLPVDIQPAPVPLRRIVLAVSEPLKENTAATLTVAGYKDAERTQPAAPGTPLTLCADFGGVTIVPGTVFLGDNGRSEAQVTAPLGSSSRGRVVLTACPYGASCAEPVAPCESLQVGIVAPSL